MNKSYVRFLCYGNRKTCDYGKTSDINEYPKCAYQNEGYCTCKEAQIQALQDEGFNIIDKEKEKKNVRRYGQLFQCNSQNIGE